jgi:hypothetical protein
MTTLDICLENINKDNERKRNLLYTVNYFNGNEDDFRHCDENEIIKYIKYGIINMHINLNKLFEENKYLEQKNKELEKELTYKKRKFNNIKNICADYIKKDTSKKNTSKKSKYNNDNDNICHICEDFDSNSKLECGHQICMFCEYKVTKCPYCRKELCD